MSREIDLDGLKVDMTMTGARVDRALFTVGVVRLEAAPDVAATHAKALSAMREAMLRNLGAEPQPGVPTRVGMFDLSGSSKGAVDGIAVEARGQVTGEPAVMQAVFVAYREQIWQAVAIVAPAQAQQARTMLDSFRLLVP